MDFVTISSSEMQPLFVKMIYFGFEFNIFIKKQFVSELKKKCVQRKFFKMFNHPSWCRLGQPEHFSYFYQFLFSRNKI